MSTVNTATQEGKRHSFYQLLKKNGYSIEIPIIQRDYAQGRKSQNEVRDLFLQALYDYLEENIPNRDLDFVYGSTEIEEGNEKFIPLDGQQRLTTLFLLHWYLATASGNIDNFKEVIFKENKSKFTYLTRTSSSEFCDALLLNAMDLSKLLAPDINKKNSLSKTIKDSSWYFLTWAKDPTIQSMLIMMDSIHEKFNNKQYFYERLTNNINPIITFLYLDLGEFKLTEDLYIKMNSRGKPLTTFENFKAKLEQHISNLFLIEDNTYVLSYEGIERNVSPKEYFSFKIDTEWANLFWQYRKLAGKDSTYDDELMNFIRVILSNQYASEPETNNENYQYLIKSESNTTDTEFISYHKLKTINALTEKGIIYLISAFENLVNGDNKIKTYLDDTYHFDEQVIFERVLTHKISLPERIRFHAYIRFLILNPVDRSGLYQWMRVIYNLTENTQLNSAEEVEKAIKSIENIITNSNNILDFLSTDANRIDFYLGRQVQEEKVKAHLIKKSEKWRLEIEELEKHNYFSGQIAFILEFSQILNYYETNENCNWSDQEDTSYYDAFADYSAKSKALFDLVGDEKNNEFILERSVLTKGDYLIPSSYNRYNLLNTKKNTRDYSWKRLLRLTPIGSNDNEFNYWKTKRYYVKEVLDDPLFNNIDIEKSLNTICKNVPNDWRKNFVTNTELIRYCQQGFVNIESEEEIHLFMHSQRNHRHREMFTYNLYTKYIKPNSSDFLPFENKDQSEIKSTDDASCIIFKDWCYKRKEYQLEVYKSPNDSSYLIEFIKVKGETNQKDFDDDIIAVLEKHKFKWSLETKTYRVLKSSDSKLITSLKEICMDFKNL